MKQTAPLIYRQGDVLIELVSSIPETAKPAKRDKGRVILAYGEVAGHSHAIAAKRVRKFDDGTVSYVDIAEALALLEHDEHAPISLPRGKYRVTIQREYSPQEIRRVAD
jgi:hypothetical protein